MKDPLENPTQNARYRRFRSRRSIWPLFSALALATFLVGAAVFLVPDHISPVERASVEPTSVSPDDKTSGDEQTESTEPENEESSYETKEPAESGDEPASEDRTESATTEPEVTKEQASEQKTSEQEDSKQKDAAREADGEGTDNQPEEQRDEDQDTSPPPPADKDMSLTVPRLGIQGDSVTNSADSQVLHEGAQKLPSTGFPWQDGANTYIAGHRIGFPGTESHNQFYNLPAMREGEPVYLTDANGKTYEYRVTEIFAVSPSESWVTEPVAGRDMVTLQTCTHSPDDWWSITPQLFGAGPETGRLVVRADRV